MLHCLDSENKKLPQRENFCDLQRTAILCDRDAVAVTHAPGPLLAARAGPVPARSPCGPRRASTQFVCPRWSSRSLSRRDALAYRADLSPPALQVPQPTLLHRSDLVLPSSWAERRARALNVTDPFDLAPKSRRPCPNVSRNRQKRLRCTHHMTTVPRSKVWPAAVLMVPAKSRLQARAGKEIEESIRNRGKAESKLINANRQLLHNVTLP